MRKGRAAAAAPFEAVVIGASTGGIEALMRLLPALPAGLPAAVAIVLHLPRDRPSLLAGIFAPKCALPVIEVEDKLAVEPGTVYVAPPDYHLLVDRAEAGLRDSPRRQFALSADAPVHWSRPSIDVLFESAADAWGRRLLGIILTGYNADGAAGLAAVQAAGGTTVVQRPESALASQMPEAALRSVAADHVLTLDGIAELLGTLAPAGTASTRTSAQTA